MVFGNGSLGDLKAVAAAIALDPETRIPVTDEDPLNGNIREPLLKLIHFMRSLSFERRPTIRFSHGLFDDMTYKIGQMVFDPPDQFSFYSTDYSPPGLFSLTETVSPEAELISMNGVIGFMNGIWSFVNYGLANIGRSRVFFQWSDLSSSQLLLRNTHPFPDGGFSALLNKMPEVGDYSSSVGVLSYNYQATASSHVSQKIDELSTLLTAGRLSKENKQVLVNAHAYFQLVHGIEHADRVLLKLMATSPEFHTSSMTRQTGIPRDATPPLPSRRPYKAIVYINLAGGADSFNILTPHHNRNKCPLYEDYFESRGGEPNTVDETSRGAGIGLMKTQILAIDGSSQKVENCALFGVNRHIPAYRDIYKEGRGLFFANSEFFTLHE